MFGRTGKVAAALACVLGGCSSQSPEAKPAEPAPAPLYDLKHPAAGLAAPAARDAEFVRGATLQLSMEGKNDEARRAANAALLDQVIESGATDLRVEPVWAQADLRANELTPHSVETVDDDVLVWTLRRARERGLRVAVMPVLRVESGEPRAELAPEDPERWFWNYQRFVMHYARLSSSVGASTFAVGSGLESLSGHEAEWRALIKDVRRAYEGPLTYAAGVEHVAEVPFWDALDLASVVALDSLGPTGDETDAQMRTRFAAVAAKLAAWAGQQKIRYVLSEVGIASRAGKIANPRQPGNAGTEDLLRQLRGYRALYEALGADGKLGGLYVFCFGQKPASALYSPHGRPAGAVLRHWYGGARTAAIAAE